MVFSFVTFCSLISDEIVTYQRVCVVIKVHNVSRDIADVELLAISTTSLY